MIYTQSCKPPLPFVISKTNPREKKKKTFTKITHQNSSFVICNEGYTIERYIHGMDASYNDIQNWHYKDLVAVFGADPQKSKTYQVATKQEAEDLFNDEGFSSAPYLQVRFFLLFTYHHCFLGWSRC